MKRGKWLFRKMNRSIRDADEVVTCFRDGMVTLRKKRRVRGFTESLKEIGYQEIRRGDLVIHGMDAFAGAIGVVDSDGKGTPVYSVYEPRPSVNAQYYTGVNWQTQSFDAKKPLPGSRQRRFWPQAGPLSPRGFVPLAGHVFVAHLV